MSSLSFARLQVAVLAHRGRWFINFRGKRAEFADRASAIREAINQADQCSKNGTPTDVVFVNDGLKQKVIWTYGVDAAPAGIRSGKARAAYDESRNDRASAVKGIALRGDQRNDLACVKEP